MAIYTDNMPHVATYWPPASPDGHGGRAYGAATLIACRWQDDAVMFRAATGEVQTSSAVVYPDRELELLGMLARGNFTEAEVSEELQPGAVEGSLEIRQRYKTDNLDGTITVHKVYL
jgi:hypothetical protein